MNYFEQQNATEVVSGTSRCALEALSSDFAEMETKHCERSPDCLLKREALEQSFPIEISAMIQIRYVVPSLLIPA